MVLARISESGLVIVAFAGSRDGCASGCDRCRTAKDVGPGHRGPDRGRTVLTRPRRLRCAAIRWHQTRWDPPAAEAVALSSERWLEEARVVGAVVPTGGAAARCCSKSPRNGQRRGFSPKVFDKGGQRGPKRRRQGDCWRLSRAHYAVVEVARGKQPRRPGRATAKPEVDTAAHG